MFQVNVNARREPLHNPGHVIAISQQSVFRRSNFHAQLGTEAALMLDEPGTATALSSNFLKVLGLPPAKKTFACTISSCALGMPNQRTHFPIVPRSRQARTARRLGCVHFSKKVSSVPCEEGRRSGALKSRRSGATKHVVRPLACCKG